MPATLPKTDRDFALSILEAPDLAAKLTPAAGELVVVDGGEIVRMAEPKRGAALSIRPGREAKVPPASGFEDPQQRARLFHAWANHELMAVELFAWAILAFPKTPQPFRRGLLGILGEEQRHAQLYLECLAALGGTFGDHPVSGHFWRDLDQVQTPLEFLARFGLIYENANLDFISEPLRLAEKMGDRHAVDVLNEVHRDEIGHVAFAWRWFRHFKDPGHDDWQAWCASIGGAQFAGRARGKAFDRSARLAAGIDAAFIDRLESTASRAPGGSLR